MKKTLQAAVLVLLAVSAVAFAARYPHSRANNHFPHEWEQTYGPPQQNPDTGTVYSNQHFTNNKN